MKKFKVVGNQNNEFNILDIDEDEVFNIYKEKYLNKSPKDKVNALQEELLKTLIYIDKQLQRIDELMENKGFIRSEFEQKNNLISQRISIIKLLADIQFKFEDDSSDDKIKSIKDVFVRNSK